MVLDCVYFLGWDGRISTRLWMLCGLLRSR
jgi:hypothetical protein